MQAGSDSAPEPLLSHGVLSAQETIMAGEPDNKHGKDGGAKGAKDPVRQDPVRKDTDMDSPGPSDPKKDVVTEGSEESFPASDPPSFMGGGAIAGSPPSRSVETIPAPEKSDSGAKEDKKQD
jgi:hypothetical protein